MQKRLNCAAGDLDHTTQQWSSGWDYSLTAAADVLHRLKSLSLRQQGFPAAGQYPGGTDSLLQLLQSFKYLNAIDSPGDCVAGQSCNKCVITIIAALCPSCQRPTTEQLHGSGDHRRSSLIQSAASITQQPLYPAPLWAMGRSGGGGGWGSLFPFHHLTLTGKERFRLTV